MFTTSIAGRTWHFRNAMGRSTPEHNGTTGGYASPVDVAVAGDDLLFVLSRGHGVETKGYNTDIYRRIGKTTIDEHHFGDFARNEFTWPTGIAVAGDGNVYCTDEYENAVLVFPDRVQLYPEFDPNGETIARWGEKGSKPGQIDGPAGIKFDADDNMLMVDGRNDRVQKFTKDGAYLMGWGGSGTDEGRFNSPWGICIDHSGDVYVADWGNDRVQKFSPDGGYLMSFDGSDVDGGALRHPSAVGVDSEGDVYVCDWGNKRVQVFEPDGTVLASLYGDANRLSKAGEYVLDRNGGINRQAFEKDPDAWSELTRFVQPVGLAVDSEDRIIVTDLCGRLQVYAKDNGWVDPIPA